MRIVVIVLIVIVITIVVKIMMRMNKIMVQCGPPKPYVCGFINPNWCHIINHRTHHNSPHDINQLSYRKPGAHLVVVAMIVHSDHDNDNHNK